MSGANALWCEPADVIGRDNTLESTAILTLSQACSAASDLLYAASGRKYPGPGSATVRPIARPRSFTLRDWSHYLQALSGVGTSLAWATGGGWFGGTSDFVTVRDSLDMGVYPIRSVNVVKIDGVVIPSDEYRVDDYRYLKRVLPSVSSQPTERWGWPTVQDLSLDDDQPGTFSVNMTWGEDPPPAGVNAAVTLAVEFAKMYSGTANRLPQRITSITRQGVSFTILDPMTFLGDGFTGLYDVDLFIRHSNPGKQTSPATVWSPDMASNKRAGTSYP